MPGQRGCGMTVRYIALDELPDGMPVATVEREGELFVYMSREHDLATVAQALTSAAHLELTRSWVHLGGAQAALT